MQFLAKKNFLVWGVLYVVIFLSGLLALSIFWLPPGYAVVGHDSGLPLDAKTFLSSRLYAWDDRLGFGLDNSANYGSLTIHFIDLVSSYISGVPYAGSFFSVFFWLGLIFVASFIFAYQFKDIFGKPFVFILPLFLTFNFYIFQSVFMLERAKFGIFAATLIALVVYFRMQEKKISVITSAVITGLLFSFFNGGGWFGITLYGGVVIIVAVLTLDNIIKALFTRNPGQLKSILIYLILSGIIYILLNAYSIMSYMQNFLLNDVSRLATESSISVEGHKDWLKYVSRSTSYLNLFRLFAVPDWYGGLSELGQANTSHPYSSLYINNKSMAALSFIFPLLAVVSFMLTKTKEHRRTLGLFGLIAAIGAVFAAGASPPFGFLFEFLMDHIPGFFLFRSAFYKFGIFYMLGMMVLFVFTLSFIIEGISERTNKHLGVWAKNTVTILLIFLVVLGWFSYHFVLLDAKKVFSWKIDQSTKVKVPSYIYDFSKWVGDNNITNQRILLAPPENQDWKNDAYNWGYWSLSPVQYALSSSNVLSKWHGLSNIEFALVEELYGFLKSGDEKSFVELANRLNVGYILLREDVLADSSWSAAEDPEVYIQTINAFASAREINTFGEWKLYKLENTKPNTVFSVSSVNIAPNDLVHLVSNFFENDYTIDLATKQAYPELANISQHQVEAFSCLSCLLENRVKFEPLPQILVLPNSLFFTFKEKQEQRELVEITDHNQKITNYLGLIIRRTSEFKRMLDIGVSEKYLIESMQLINLYLSQLNNEINASPTDANDFKLADQVLEYINSIELEFGNYMKTTDYKRRSNRFSEEVLSIIWEIDRTKEFFSHLVGASERWSKEKVYKVKFSESGNYTLYFPSQAFPQTLDGSIILPENVLLTRDSEEKKLRINTYGKDWLSADVGWQNEGEADMVLYFGEVPNLFKIETSGLEKFPLGKQACYSGKIINFDRRRTYQVLVLKTDRLRSANVYFRDKNYPYSTRHGFLIGEDYFEIPAVAVGELSSYIYYPTYTAKDIFLYICSDDKVLPEVDKIIVSEYFSPLSIIVKKSNVEIKAAPIIEYKRVNPTKYEVISENASGPFILVFNDKFNPSWRLSIQKNGNNFEKVDKHFMVDGFANGWYIDESSTQKYSLEYVPQKAFYVGAIISLGVGFFCIGWLIYTIRFKKKAS